MALWLLSLIIAYLLGSIPFGFILAKTKKIDIRRYGSGKIGAANIYRTLGIKAGILVLFADLAKGFVAVIIAKSLLDNPLAWASAGFLAIVGHNWSVFLRFQGGRGVAAYFGGLLALYFPVGAISSILTLLIMALSRYASLGSLLGSLSSVVLLFVFRGNLLKEFPVYLTYTMLGTTLIFFQHRDNISRLLSGKERKLEFKR